MTSETDKAGLEPSGSSQTDQNGLSTTDRSLVAMVRDGDEDAAGILYQRYAKRVLGLVQSRFGEKLWASTEPEDIVQSVFRSVFKGVQSGNYDAPPGTTLWNLLAVIAVNKLASKYEYYSAKRRDVDRNEPLESGSDKLSLAIDQASVEFFEVCIRETIELLNSREQEVLSLRVQGHSVAEISEMVDRSRRGVERSLQQIRERLASLLLDK